MLAKHNAHSTKQGHDSIALGQASKGLPQKVVARVDWKMHYRRYLFQIVIKRHEKTQKQEAAAAQRQHLEYSKWSELGGRGQSRMFSNHFAGRHASERRCLPAAHW